jgi:hypothetical protein
MVQQFLATLYISLFNQHFIFRQGMAAYGMRKWQTAVDHFSQVLQEFPNNLEAKEQLKRAEARLEESETEKFNFKVMCSESQKRMCEFDIADYVSPIEIGNVKGKGWFLRENLFGNLEKKG